MRWPILRTARIAGFPFSARSDTAIAINRAVVWTSSSSDHAGEQREHEPSGKTAVASCDRGNIPILYGVPQSAKGGEEEFKCRVELFNDTDDSSLPIRGLLVNSILHISTVDLLS